MSFDRAEFGSASFRGATFTGPVSFRGARFHGDARFGCVTFEGTASFRGSGLRAGRPASSTPRAGGRDTEWPEEVTFRRWADFRHTVFGGEAKFGGAQFEGRARFARRSIQRTVCPSWAPRSLVPERSAGRGVARPLVLDQGRFRGAGPYHGHREDRSPARGRSFEASLRSTLVRGDVTLEGGSVRGAVDADGPLAQLQVPCDVAPPRERRAPDPRGCRPARVQLPQRPQPRRAAGSRVATEFCVGYRPRGLTRQAILDELVLRVPTESGVKRPRRRASDRRAHRPRLPVASEGPRGQQGRPRGRGLLLRRDGDAPARGSAASSERS